MYRSPSLLAAVAFASLIAACASSKPKCVVIRVDTTGLADTTPLPTTGGVCQVTVYARQACDSVAGSNCR
jgi:hypothetical protein